MCTKVHAHTRILKLLSIWFIYWMHTFLSSRNKTVCILGLSQLSCFSPITPTPKCHSTLPSMARDTFHFFISLCLCSGWPFCRDTVSPPPNHSNIKLPCILQAQLKCLVPPFPSFLSLSYTSQVNFCHIILYVHLSPSTEILYLLRIGAYDLLLKSFISKTLHIKYIIVFPLTCTIHIKIHLQATVTGKEFAKSAVVFFFLLLIDFGVISIHWKLQTNFPICHQRCKNLKEQIKCLVFWLDFCIKGIRAWLCWQLSTQSKNSNQIMSFCTAPQYKQGSNGVEISISLGIHKYLIYWTKQLSLSYS